MRDDPPADSSGPTAEDDALTRRRLLAVTGGVGTALLAGCSSQSDSGQAGDNSVSTTDDSVSTADDRTSGSFRLLISDQPVAIDDFDSLEVSFDRARIFRNDLETETETDTATPSTEMETETDTDTDTDTETATTTATETATTEAETEEETDDEADDADDADEDDDDAGGFEVIDLDGATVDLTEVLGKKASEVFEGELKTGRYTKIELYAVDVVGVVDGETVAVKIPSGKLQITKPFEVRAGETLSFVFDINVVKRGPNGYNLLPVISESGVAGEEVDVEEVDRTTPEPTADAANATSTGSPSTPTTTESSDAAAGSSPNGNGNGNGNNPNDS